MILYKIVIKNDLVLLSNNFPQGSTGKLGEMKERLYRLRFTPEGIFKSTFENFNNLGSK